MEAFQQRVIAEEAELSAKLIKLGEFVHGKVFSTLPRVDQELLQEQDGHMRAYLGVLRRRIERFKAN